MLPEPYTSADTQRMTLGYFALSGLDLLGVVESKIPKDERQGLIDWAYAQQLSLENGGGFRPSPAASDGTSLEVGHITSAYNALQLLAILRDDLSRLDRTSLQHFIAACQHEDGSFSPGPRQSERDARFVYCAFALCDMLQCWSAIDVDSSVGFLLASRNFDGGFGQGPGQESQGGSTYCALASLALASRLDAVPNLEQTIDWLCLRQLSGSGFNGRPEKAVDTCYSFWCGASLEILAKHSLIDSESDVRWLLSAQHQLGGIAKTLDSYPDPMHAYLSHAALSLHRAHGEGEEDEIGRELREGLQPLEPRWNLSVSSAAWLRERLRKE
ncbi:geranylgeranyl transferase type-1 subunit beta [Tilletia horrida]|nr:geranylgeranyl transferase type-1 subunit beta [Tilletia horrida]